MNAHSVANALFHCLYAAKDLVTLLASMRIVSPKTVMAFDDVIALIRLDCQNGALEIPNANVGPTIGPDSDPHHNLD
jgi:hypothetical protein